MRLNRKRLTNTKYKSSIVSSQEQQQSPSTVQTARQSSIGIGENRTTENIDNKQTQQQQKKNEKQATQIIFFFFINMCDNYSWAVNKQSTISVEVISEMESIVLHSDIARLVLGKFANR